MLNQALLFINNQKKNFARLTANPKRIGTIPRFNVCTRFLCSEPFRGARLLTKSPQFVVDAAPLPNRRCSRLPAGPPRGAPIVNRLYRGLAVRLAATLSLAMFLGGVNQFLSAGWLVDPLGAPPPGLVGGP